MGQVSSGQLAVHGVAGHLGPSNPKAQRTAEEFVHHTCCGHVFCLNFVRVLFGFCSQKVGFLRTRIH